MWTTETDVDGGKIHTNKRIPNTTPLRSCVAGPKNGVGNGKATQYSTRPATADAVPRRRAGYPDYNFPVAINVIVFDIGRLRTCPRKPCRVHEEDLNYLSKHAIF